MVQEMAERHLVVVYGGQYGSEGKGDVCAHIARSYLKTPEKYSDVVACRVGGTNAGHTFLDKDFNQRVVRTLPVASFIIPGCVTVLGAGALIDMEILLEEIDLLDEVWGHSYQPILLDNNATFICEEDKQAEGQLTGRIGSTGKGVGAAQARKIMRTAPNASDLTGHIVFNFGDRIQIIDTVEYLNNDGGNVLHIVEGTQGYLLSNDVGGYYPFCTSRNCGPEAIMSQVGINPRSYDEVDIIGVFRTFPIRVGGPSGHLPGELTWEQMEQITGGAVRANHPEITTVTKKPRRIARRDPGLTEKAIRETSPTAIALTFLDYEMYDECSEFVLEGTVSDILEQRVSIQDLPGEILKYIADFEQETGVGVGIVSIGQHLTIGEHSNG